MPDVAPHNMTGPSAPEPYVASASSTYATLAPWKAFDGAVGSGQYWLSNNTPTGWLKIYLGPDGAAMLATYEIQINTVPENDRAPKDWTLEGSNNDSDWFIISTVTGETAWSSGEKREFNVTDQSTPYKYFKVMVTANNTSGYLQIAELYLWTAIPYHLAGTVKEKGVSAIRTVRAYIRSTGELYSTTASEADGTFSLDAPNDTTEMFVVAFDDDAGDQYNALIYDRVKGVAV